MLSQIKQILESANPEYTVIYEEKHLMNVKVDELPVNARFAYIEEFLKGQYRQEKYFKTRIMQMQIYFSRFVDMHDDAIVRESLRDEIDAEIVRPFMKTYNESGFFEPVEIWNIYYPFPRWDANEVSVMLEFACKIQIC
ncbi:MAG: hypothetical protein LBH19_02410, partial [Dysgonamonadaceae bacterium]|jgi:hypothetical protein|nr:hypothetical protein [Dysgonamonadaceae bacterium]